MMGLGPLIASFAAMDIAAFTERLKRNIMLYGLAALFVLTAYVLGVAALAVHLSQFWGLPIALLVVAGGALLLAVIFYLSVTLTARAEVKRKKQAVAANSRKTLALTAALTAVPLLLKSKPLMFASIAGGLGFLALSGGRTRRRFTNPGE